MMFFFDTYALVQIALGVQSYAPFKEVTGTSLLNLYEAYYILCKENKEVLAEKFFDKLVPTCIEIVPQNVKTAAQFRLKNIKKGFSYIDALGYIIARSRGLIFLTGDDAFQGLEGVEFVK